MLSSGKEENQMARLDTTLVQDTVALDVPCAMIAMGDDRVEDYIVELLSEYLDKHFDMFYLVMTEMAIKNIYDDNTKYSKIFQVYFKLEIILDILEAQRDIEERLSIGL
jgi:hypothetical protein